MRKQNEEVLPTKVERVWREAVPNDRLAHVVKDLFREVVRGMQMRLMKHSVSHGYWAFLRILWERDGITQRELSKLSGVTEPTTYSALKSMEVLGYVTRQRQASDMRHNRICLTPKGKALKEKLIPLAEELNSAAIRGIPPEDIAVFRRTAIAMTKNLAQDEVDLNRRMPPLRKLA